MYRARDEYPSLAIDDNSLPIVGHATLNQMRAQKQAQHYNPLGNWDWIGFHNSLSLSLLRFWVERDLKETEIVKFIQDESFFLEMWSTMQQKGSYSTLDSQQSEVWNQ